MTRRFLWGAAAALTLIACGKSQRVVPPDTVLLAQTALAPFKQELAGALRAGLEEGPVAAVEVCRVDAPKIAAASASANTQIGRSSHRYRSPANAPAAWMKPMLRAYEADPDDRAPRAVWVDDHTVGYVEPIYVNAMCLVCHGESIAPELAERIDELYPHDAARGFRDGDFRGIFWVTMRTDEP